MNKITLFFGVVVVVACSYASLWYGFGKGYQYNNSQNLIESLYISNALKLIRGGKNKEAIDVLEGMLNIQIVERSVSDEEFVKYIIGMTEPDKEVQQKLEARIIQYRKDTNYNCTESKPVCDFLNAYIYGDKQVINNQRDADSDANSASPVH